MEIAAALARLADRQNLAEAEMGAVVGKVMEGELTAAQLGALLLALRVKGETVDEIVGAARAMRARARRIAPQGRPILDTCGTGGDGRGTLNISTAAALVAAAAGATVAKHGNRAMSGRVGGADVLEALGVRVDLPPERVAACIDCVGIGFLFAPLFHPAMRHAAQVRRELGVRTLFNLLGPLCNPAGATHQLVGVFAAEWVEPLARALGRLGSVHALVVHGAGGLDEISLEGPTAVAEYRQGVVQAYKLRPEDFGLPRCRNAELAVGSAAESAARIRAVLEGAAGPDAGIVLLNAGAALYVADRVPSIGAGIAAARAAVAEGRAKALLQRLVEFTNR